MRMQATGRACPVAEAIRALRGSGVALPHPLRSDLEAAFATDLTRVRLHAGPEADSIARALGARGAASGNAIFFRAGTYQPWTPAGRELIAHEVCHLLQQARDQVGGEVLPGGLRVSHRADPWERAADEAGRRFRRGQHLDGVLPPGAESPGAESLGSPSAGSEVTVQRWDSFEHRLLGDTPQATLVNMMANGSPAQRNAAYSQVLSLMEFLGTNATTIQSAAQITQVCPYVRPVQLPGSGLWVTYGEINSLADYLADHTEIASTPQAILLPILQTMREVSFNVLSYLQAHLSLPWPLNQLLAWSEFSGALHMQWAPGWLHKILESSALDELTTGLGIAGRDHYTGLLARNACHFAPFTWFRWLAYHDLARSQALTAYQNQGQPSYATDVTQAWITHGYADHFLQDSFASGHLVNKTQVMQWFIQLAEENTLSLFGWEIGMPIADWDEIKNLTVGQQPGLSGQQLYQQGFKGPSNDPQTAEEQPNAASAPLYQLRMDATGIQGPNLTGQSQNYMNYLTMLQNLVVQAASASLHDTFNARELAVATQASGTGSFTVYGDDAMLNGGTGPGLASAAAMQSQQAISDILSTGDTAITVAALQSQFPTYVQSNGNWLSLPQWHAEGGEVYQEVESLFTDVLTYGKGVVSAFTNLGVVSVDDPQAPAFSPVWGPAVGMGCVTSLRPAAAFFNNALYIFYVASDTGDISAVAMPAAGGWAAVSLPAGLSSEAAPSAAVWNNQLYLAYKAPNNTVQLLTTADGATWTSVPAPPGAGGGPYGVGLAACNGALYVAYALGSRSVQCMWMDAGGWHGPATVPSAAAYGSPALAANATTLVLAYEGDANGGVWWAGLPPAASWGSAAKISSDQTQGEVSVAAVAGGVLLGYWGTGGGTTSQLYTRYQTTGSTSWGGATKMSKLAANGPAAVAANQDLQSVCVFPQLGALYVTTYSAAGGTWGQPYNVGGMYSGLPPTLTLFQDQLWAVTQASWELYVRTSQDGVAWSLPVPPLTGVGGVPASIVVDGTTLWLAYYDAGCINLLTNDGTTWSGPTPVTGPNSAIGGPALAELNGLVYLAYLSGSAASPAVAWQSFDPVSGVWTSLGAIPTTSKPGSPVLTVWGDYLCLGYVDSQNVYTQLYDSVADTWDEPPQKVGGQTATAMALGVFQGNIILVWQGTGSTGSLNAMWNKGTGWTGKQTFESVSGAPGLLSFRDPDQPDADQDALWICYQGAGTVNGLCRRVLTATD